MSEASCRKHLRIAVTFTFRTPTRVTYPPVMSALCLHYWEKRESMETSTPNSAPRAARRSQIRPRPAGTGRPASPARRGRRLQAGPQPPAPAAAPAGALAAPPHPAPAQQPPTPPAPRQAAHRHPRPPQSLPGPHRRPRACLAAGSGRARALPPWASEASLGIWERRRLGCSLVSRQC